MGKGIALQFKQAFPENFTHYAKACKARQMQPGRMLVFETGSMLNPQVHHQFPDQAPLEGQIEDGGHRGRD